MLLTKRWRCVLLKNIVNNNNFYMKNGGKSYEI